MSANQSCLIWGTHCKLTKYKKFGDQDNWWFVNNSRRAGGSYEIRSTHRHQLQSLSNQEKARLTTWIIDHPPEGGEFTEITESTISEIQSKNPLSSEERAGRLLCFIEKESTKISDAISIKTDYAPEALAWSESTDWEEVEYLLNHLLSEGWLSVGGSPAAVSYTVTVAGRNRIGHQKNQMGFGTV